MGFMDKAKQMAEQAQKKLEETQNQFNQGQAKQAGGEGGGGVRYDEHGRPVEEAPPASEQPPAPPVGEPLGGTIEDDVALLERDDAGEAPGDVYVVQVDQERRALAV